MFNHLTLSPCWEQCEEDGTFLEYVKEWAFTYEDFKQFCIIIQFLQICLIYFIKLSRWRGIPSFRWIHIQSQHTQYRACQENKEPIGRYLRASSKGKLLDKSVLLLAAQKFSEMDEFDMFRDSITCYEYCVCIYEV